MGDRANVPPPRTMPRAELLGEPGRVNDKLLSRKAIKDRQRAIGLARLDGQDLPVDLFSCLQPPGLVMSQGNCQCFGNRCHETYVRLRGPPELLFPDLLREASKDFSPLV